MTPTPTTAPAPEVVSPLSAVPAPPPFWHYVPPDPTLHDVLRAVSAHAAESAQWRIEANQRFDVLERGLTTNTEICQTVQSAITTGKVMTRIVKWVGAMAVALASMGWAAREVLGGHTPPGGGIGPTP